MAWEIEFANEFEEWWDSLDESEQESVAASVDLLEARGPLLPFPHSSGIEGSKYGHMRELRIQHDGRPLRVFYAFNPKRTGILLIGGDKTGDSRFYERMIPRADAIYEQHLRELEEEDSNE